MDFKALKQFGLAYATIAGKGAPVRPALLHPFFWLQRDLWPSKGLYAALGKRFFDIVGGLALLLVSLPLITGLLAAVALGGGHPLFAHSRIGRGGRSFSCLKIRSMVPDAEERLAAILRLDPARAEEWARDHKLADDPRVTQLGRMLRKTSLDELPQVWNVIRGDMSLVGPRPVTHEELDRYGVAAGAYVSVRPGLTGPWQIQGRNAISYDERVALDAAYATGMSFFGDIRILLMTAFAVVGATGR